MPTPSHLTITAFAQLIRHSPAAVLACVKAGIVPAEIINGEFLIDRSCYSVEPAPASEDPDRAVLDGFSDPPIGR